VFVKHILSEIENKNFSKKKTDNLGNVDFYVPN